MCVCLSCVFFILFDCALEIDRCLKFSAIPNMWGWPGLSEPCSNQIYANNPLWSAKWIFSSQTNLYAFFLGLFLPWPLRPLSSFGIQPQNLMPLSRHDHPLSSTHHHANEHSLPWPTDLLFHSKPSSASSM